MKEHFFQASDLADLLSAGSPALFPTDTVPALAAKPIYSKQLWEIKKRKPDKPLILMGHSVEGLLRYVSSIAISDACQMAEKYWPGSLTMVLPSNSKLVNYLNPGGQTLGIRIPNCPFTKSLLIKSGPLATTSANLSGQKTIVSNKDLQKLFPDIPLLAPDNWPKPSGMASTVILWKDEVPAKWHLLRKGAVIPDECHNLF